MITVFPGDNGSNDNNGIILTVTIVTAYSNSNGNNGIFCDNGRSGIFTR